MSIYEEMSMYGDFYHHRYSNSHTCSPFLTPRVHLSWIVSRLPGRLTIGGKSKKWSWWGISPDIAAPTPRPFLTAMLTWSLV